MGHCGLGAADGGLLLGRRPGSEVKEVHRDPVLDVCSVLRITLVFKRGSLGARSIFLATHVSIHLEV
jgi:hypothetical protein